MDNRKKQKTLRKKNESWLDTKKSTMKIEETLPVIIYVEYKTM